MKFERLIKKIVKTLDPKLEKYREKAEKEPFSPKTTKELVGVIKRTTNGILSSSEKNMFASLMSYKDKLATDLMIPKDEMIFVSDEEVLGPLNLDKLYKSGYSVFPVVDKNEKIIGLIKTDTLNSLEKTDGKKAKKYLDNSRVIFINEKTTLKEVLDEFLKSSSLLFIAKNSKNEILGMLTFDIVIYYLLGLI